MSLSNAGNKIVTNGVAEPGGDSKISHAVISHAAGVGEVQLNTPLSGSPLLLNSASAFAGGGIGVTASYDIEAKFVFLYQIEGTHPYTAIREFFVPNPSGFLPSSMGYFPNYYLETGGPVQGTAQVLPATSPPSRNPNECTLVHVGGVDGFLFQWTNAQRIENDRFSAILFVTWNVDDGKGVLLQDGQVGGPNLAGGGLSVVVPSLPIPIFGAVNTAPTLEPIGPQIINEGGELILTLNATDPDEPGVALTFSASAENAVASVNGTTLTVTPDADILGDILVTVTVSDGDEVVAQTFTLTVNPVNAADICFPAGTPVTTDQGSIAIEKLIPGTHTIKDQPILGISQTKSSDNHLLCFEKHALGHNIPDQQTIVSREHCILYKGKMKRACTFMRHARIRKMKYTGETLYNVVLEKHGSMVVNNMTVETLHPKHWVAKKISRK